MKELEFLELQEVGIEELVAYSKLENNSGITILDDLNYGLFNQLVVWTDQLKLIFFIIKGTRKVAFVGNSMVALKIAGVLQVKAQIMKYSLLKPKKLLGKIYTPKAIKNYIVQAFDENGKPIPPFVDTDIENASCENLLKFKFAPYKYAMKVKGAGNNKIESLESVRELRRKFLKNGSI